MTRAEIHEFNHTPHILASVFLCGCWSPLWILLYLFRDRQYYCSKCGTVVLERAPKRKRATIDFLCAHCDEEIEADQEDAGTRMECPGCGERILVPRFLPPKE